MSKKTEALLGRLKTALETEADKDAARERARVQAIVRTLLRWLGGLDEATRAAIFAGLEEVATTRDRTLIAEHALRPDATESRPVATLKAVPPVQPPAQGQRRSQSNGAPPPAVRMAEISIIETAPLAVPFSFA